MRVGSLFTGVGGFDLGLECAGFDVAWQVESDKWCQQVLRARWPDVDLYGDVKDVGGIRRPEQQGDGRQDGNATERRTSGRGRFHGDTASEQGEADGRTTLAPVDLICGGFPCQDLSVAGKREGLAGERSGLFFEFMRVVGEVAPRWVLIENVPGLLSSNGGRDMGAVVGTLGELGYGWTYRVLDTQHFGPPQRRRRVFIVGRAGGVCPPEVLLEPESVPGHPASRREAGEGAAGESATGTFPALRGFGHGWQGQHNDDIARAVAGAVKAGGGPDENDAKDGRIGSTLRVGGREQGAGNSYDNTPWVHRCFADLRRHDEGHRGMVREKPCINATNNDPVYPTLRQNWRNNSNPATEARMLVEDETATPLDGHYYKGPGSRGNQEREYCAGPIPRRLTPRETERLQGFPDHWTATGIDAEGEPVEVSDTQRYKQMGNAVSVPVAAWIGSRIVAAEMGAI